MNLHIHLINAISADLSPNKNQYLQIKLMKNHCCEIFLQILLPFQNCNYNNVPAFARQMANFQQAGATNANERIHT